MNSNVTLINRFYDEIWSQGNRETIKEIIHPDYHPDDVAMPEKGPELLIKETAYFRSIFTNLKYEVIETNEKSEEEIWVIYEITGIHTSSAWGFEPTHKPVKSRGMGIFTIKEGKIIDQRRIYCMYNLFSSSGAIPSFWELADKLRNNS